MAEEVAVVFSNGPVRLGRDPVMGRPSSVVSGLGQRERERKKKVFSLFQK
jgi:hypothetical protein